MKIKTLGCFLLLKIAEILAVVSVVVWIPFLGGMAVYTLFPILLEDEITKFSVWSMGCLFTIGIPLFCYVMYLIVMCIPEMWFDLVGFIESNWEKAKKISGED